MYEQALGDLNQSCPRLHAGLARAHANRSRWLPHFLSKEHAILAGLNDLLIYLDRIERAADSHETFAKITFLLSRARLNVEAASEAALSGIPAVSFDLMRDLMEVEFLLREFAADTEQAERWLAADERERLRRFSPVALRERHAKRLGIPSTDLRDSADYKAHSELLHVTPLVHPLTGSGIEDAQMVTRVLGCFVEIFEHGRRVVVAAGDLAARLRLSDWPDPTSELTQFGSAWEQLQQFQAIYMLFLPPTQQR